MDSRAGKDVEVVVVKLWIVEHSLEAQAAHAAVVGNGIGEPLVSGIKLIERSLGSCCDSVGKIFILLEYKRHEEHTWLNLDVVEVGGEAVGKHHGLYLESIEKAHLCAVERRCFTVD